MRLDHNGIDVDGECCPDFTKRVCFSCRRHVMVRIATLATNLAIAGALAQAWLLGNRNGAEWYAGIAVRRAGP